MSEIKAKGLRGTTWGPPSAYYLPGTGLEWEKQRGRSKPYTPKTPPLTGRLGKARYGVAWCLAWLAAAGLRPLRGLYLTSTETISSSVLIQSVLSVQREREVDERVKEKGGAVRHLHWPQLGAPREAFVICDLHPHQPGCSFLLSGIRVFVFRDAIRVII